MAHIVILVVSIGADDNGKGVVYSGIARCSDMTKIDAQINWSVSIVSDALVDAINTAIVNAAVAAAASIGITVGVLDRKILVGAAIGL